MTAKVIPISRALEIRIEKTSKQIRHDGEIIDEAFCRLFNELEKFVPGALPGLKILILEPPKKD